MPVRMFTSSIPRQARRFGTTRQVVQAAEAKRRRCTTGDCMFATFRTLSLTAKQERLSETSMRRILPPFREPGLLSEWSTFFWIVRNTSSPRCRHQSVLWSFSETASCSLLYSSSTTMFTSVRRRESCMQSTPQPDSRLGSRLPEPASLMLMNTMFRSPLTSFAAAEGLLVIPTSTTLVAYEGDTTPPTVTFGNQTPAAECRQAGTRRQSILHSRLLTICRALKRLTRRVRCTSQQKEQIRHQQVTVTDNAGNTATFTSPAVHIDFTVPSTSISIPGISQPRSCSYGSGFGDAKRLGQSVRSSKYFLHYQWRSRADLHVARLH